MSALKTHPGVALERVNYFPRQLITADDMLVEQEYFRQKLRRHNRFLHGWGSVCGLVVTAAATPEIPGQVRISEGYALSPQGDEIYVPEAFCMDLAKCGFQTVVDPCEPGTTTVRPIGDKLFIAIRYVECRTRPVRIHPVGCGCDETGCEYTRIRDDYRIECLFDLPDSHRPQRSPGLCELIQQDRIPSCPSCPDEPWVVLAQVTWDMAQGITDANINNDVRRQLYSTSLLQEQLIDCCCQRDTPPPPPAVPGRVTSVVPAPGAVINLNTGQNPPANIVVGFNKTLSAATVTTQSLRVRSQIVGGSQKTVTGSVSYNPQNNTAVFTPKDPFLAGSLAAAVPVTVSITAFGSGSKPILDSDGLALDGDSDGAPGGNFASQFTIIPLQIG